MTRLHLALAIVALSMLAACASAPAPGRAAASAGYDPQQDLGLLWVKHSAEYTAITRQTYRFAEAALPRFIADTSWSAMPGQSDAEKLPPAVILDVDETVVSNVDFQLTFERPFTNRKLYDFYREHAAIPVAGVVDFVAAARKAGVDIFFVTNRPCETIDEEPDPCPQRHGVIDELESIGISTDDEHVLLADENDWDRAKIRRREHVANTHRVIMLFGDDLGDFVPCVRTKLYGPCTEPATKASRAQLVEKYTNYWGNGWYILPGPMHGSWTSFK
ncbi:MAG: acid phosphatase [Gammaproteobacteria bacterium]|nr:acid phosphatase [Gammaproteobacteria bacterium]MDH3362786.1 acid phosphatase [Gammaproteobacteria bacterium]MDH3480206.1 acid phosphatase [Gammaproteobacteria bacterium]